MHSKFEVVGIRPYVRDRVTPYAQNTLHLLTEQFSCGKQWRGPERSHLPTLTLQAAPLSADARAGHGYGRRTGAAIGISALADVALGEYTWAFGSITPVIQGQREGQVRLNCNMHVRFGVERGVPVDPIDLPDDTSRDTFLCWADEYLLPDGSSCLAVKTFPGTLWFHSAAKKYWWQSLHGKSVQSLQYRRSRAVRLAVTSGRDTYPRPEDHLFGGYWDHMTTRDTSGRTWRIAKSVVEFSGNVRLEVVGQYDRRLQKEAAILMLMPPYDVAWAPRISEEGEPQLLIPLNLG